jgi:hypothetical protein
MIPPEAKKHFEGVRHHEMFEMQKALGRLLDARKAEMAVRGMGMSGTLLFMLTEEATNSLKARGRFLLGNLLRCLSAHGVELTAKTVAEGAALLKDAIEGEIVVIRSFLFGQSAFASPGSQAAKRQLEIQFAQEGPRMTDRLVTEFEIAAAASKRSTEKGNLTFNVNGPVGLIQTGDNSEGTVHQHIDQGLKQEIATAVDFLLQLLDRPENASLGNRGNLREMALEAKTEAEKAEPNGLKLKASLRGIAEVTKFVGSLEPAYSTLKPLLGHLGIYLP